MFVSCRYNGQASSDDFEVLLVDVLQEQSREKLPEAGNFIYYLI